MKFVVWFGIFLLLISATVWAEDESLIQKVIDGETIELSDGRRIHLIGVKTNHVTPILTERFKMSPDKIASLPTAQLSDNAKTYMENHAVGKNVILSYDSGNESRQNIDNENRTLAYVWYATHSVASSEDSEGAAKVFGVSKLEKLLNQELILMGHALVDTGTSFVQQEAFLNSEKSAAKSKQGFWRSASEIYSDLLKQAQGSQFGSTAGFVTEEAQKMSLESSAKVFEELIVLNPKDFRPRYERSWLGANPIHDKVSESNLQDIDQAIQLSHFNPKCYMQKSFLLQLLGKYDEASKAYNQMVPIAGKLGIPPLVSPMSEENVKEKYQDKAKDEKENLLRLEAQRATLNEDHFLVFMARIKSYGDEIPENAKKIYDQAAEQARFQVFLKKHDEFLITAKPRDLIYRTQWALKGHELPEQVIKWLEAIGEVSVIEARPPEETPAKQSKS